MTPADIELTIEALSMAASRKESMSRAERSGDTRLAHERRAIAMRSLQKRLMDLKQGKPRAMATSTGLTAIERALVNWCETAGLQVQHDGNAWNAWAGGRMLPLTDIATTIALELP